MIPSYLDPTHYTALQSLDLGNVLSLDGRAHPLGAETPLSIITVPATVVPTGTQTGPSVPPVALPGDGTPAGLPSVSLGDVAGMVLPSHIGARVAIGFIAVIILALVAARFIL